MTRIEKAGYTFSMETLSDVPDETMGELERVSEAWRAGVDERGFTMALERLGGAHQHDTVVAIARDGEGHVRGFLHFVPSYGREAVSLSFMRRDPETPNGLTEFLVARSIEAFRERGTEEVSLNFAAFARLLTEPENIFERVAARVLRWADAWFQIESLYRFNAKFDPRWEPRYVLYEGRLGLARAGPRGGLGGGPDPEAAGPPMRLPRGLGARRRGRRCGSACFVLAGVALLLPAWALYLAVVLPREHVAPNWDVVWVGLDLALAALAAAAVLAFRRRSPWTPVLGGALAAALVCDAWFDVMTSDGNDRWLAIGAGALRRAAGCRPRRRGRCSLGA